MLDPKIQAAADVVVMLNSHISEDAYLRALKSEDPEYALRVLLVASVKGFGLRRTLDNYRATLTRVIYDTDGAPTDQTKQMMRVLADKDLFGGQVPPEMHDWLFSEFVATCSRDPALLRDFEDIFSPKYTSDELLVAWRAGLNYFDSVRAKLLLSKGPVSGLDYEAVVDTSLQASAPAVREYLAALDDAALRRADEVAKGLLDRAREQSVDFRCAFIHALLVRTECVKRFGAEMESLTSFFDAIESIDYPFEREQYFWPLAFELFDLARLAGRVESPALTKVLRGGGLKELKLNEVEALLEAGVPLSGELERSFSVFAGEGYFMLNHVNEEARLAVARAMDAGVKLRYVQEGLPQMLKGRSSSWGNGVKSCVDDEFLRLLRDQGFDLLHQHGVNLSARGLWLHERKPEAARYVFTALHGLGVYPQDLKYQGYSPLHYAAAQKDIKALEVLLDAGHDVNVMSSSDAWPSLRDSKVGEWSYTPLAVAVRYGGEEVVRFLLERGADTGIKVGNDVSLSKLAKDDAVKRLLKSYRLGANIDAAMPSRAGSKTDPKPASDHGIL